MSPKLDFDFSTAGPAEELMIAMALVQGYALGDETRLARTARYQVTLGDSKDRVQAASFFTSVLYGKRRRVDLEDACDLGDYDTVVVHKQRGAFTPAEAARVLDQVIDDLSFSHLPWLILNADATDLVLVQECEFTDIDPGDTRTLHRRIRAMLRRVGLAPRRLAGGHPDYLELSLRVDADTRQVWALPLTTTDWETRMARDFPRLRGAVVLVNEYTPEQQREAAGHQKRLLASSPVVPIAG